MAGPVANAGSAPADSGGRRRTDRSGELAALRATVLTLEARLTAMERGRGPQHEAAVVLLEQIATSTRSLPFKAWDLLRHARVDDAQSAALERAWIEGVGELGAYLRNRKGQCGNLVVERQGRYWRVTHVAHHLPTAADR